MAILVQGPHSQGHDRVSRPCNSLFVVQNHTGRDTDVYPSHVSHMGRDTGVCPSRVTPLLCFGTIRARHLGMWHVIRAQNLFSKAVNVV